MPRSQFEPQNAVFKWLKHEGYSIIYCFLSWLFWQTRDTGIVSLWA